MRPLNLEKINLTLSGEMKGFYFLELFCSKCGGELASSDRRKHITLQEERQAEPESDSLMASEWHASKDPHVFIFPELTFPSLLSNLVPVILLIQLLWQTGSYSHAVRRWTRSVVLVHQFTPLFIHSQASEQDSSKLLSHKKAFLWKLQFSTSYTRDKCRWLV